MGETESPQFIDRRWRGELAQSISVTYGATCSEGGQGGRLQNTPPRPAKLSTPQEGN